MSRLAQLAAAAVLVLTGCSAEKLAKIKEYSPSGPYEPTEAEQEVWQLYQDGRLITARRKADEVLADNPYSIYGHYVLGQVYRESEGQLPKSMSHVGRARELFETRYPDNPQPDGPMKELHQEILFAAQGVAGELEEFEYQLQLLDFYDSLYSPELVAEHAWPLMKLGRHEEARKVAKEAIESKTPGARSLGLNALCAIEGEAATRRPRLAACQEALEHAQERAAKDDPKAGPHERTPVAVHAYNASEAAISTLDFDTAETFAIAGTSKLDFTPANPWRVLMRLYLSTARIDDGLYALQEMLRWRQRQPPYLRDQDRAQTDVAQATFLLAVGRTGPGLQLVDRALRKPDRRGLTSSTLEQATGAHALLRIALRRTDAEVRAERAVWDAELDADEKDGVIDQVVVGPAERAARDVADRERVRNLLRDEARLQATFRMYVSGGLEPIESWMLGDLVHVVGPGVARVAIEEARDAEPADDAQLFAPYYDGLLGEVALAEGDEDEALRLIDRALIGLPQAEVMLRARLAAVGAMAAAAKGDAKAELGYLGTAMQLDPGAIRRLGLSLPTRITNSATGEMAELVADKLDDSPRLRSGDDFAIQITGSGKAIRLCLMSPEGNELSCTNVDWSEATTQPEDGEDGAEPVPLTDAQAAARTLQAFHERAFGFGLELSSIDLQSLDGRTVVAEEAARDKMQNVLDTISEIESD